MTEELECYVHTVTSRMPVSEERLGQIKKETATDQTIKTLFSTIGRGCPETRKQTPCEIYDYWNYRDELSEVDGILLKQDKIIIPLSMRGNMLERIHESHMGIEKSKRRARDIMFWPRMNEQIKAVVSKCKTCQAYQRTHGARNNTIETLGNGRN